jgi:hypothetical protein
MEKAANAKLNGLAVNQVNAGGSSKKAA